MGNGDDAKITKQINCCSEAYCTVCTVLPWSVGHPCVMLWRTGHLIILGSCRYILELHSTKGVKVVVAVMFISAITNAASVF